MNHLQPPDNSSYHKLIFVVEDDLDVSRLIEHNLSMAGYEVATFFSGAPVVPSAMTTQPALFLLDIMLPGINGFDLCRQIRQNEKLARIPVMFLSARTEEPDRVQAFEVGGDGYITKPFSPRELIVRIGNALRGRVDVSAHEVIQVGELEIDVSSMTVRVEGRAVVTTVRFYPTPPGKNRKGRQASELPQDHARGGVSFRSAALKLKRTFLVLGGASRDDEGGKGAADYRGNPRGIAEARQASVQVLTRTTV